MQLLGTVGLLRSVDWVGKKVCFGPRGWGPRKVEMMKEKVLGWSVSACCWADAVIEMVWWIVVPRLERC